MMADIRQFLPVAINFQDSKKILDLSFVSIQEWNRLG